MPAKQYGLWLAAGMGTWAVATAALMVLGGPLLGSGTLRYALSAAVIIAAFIGLFMALARMIGTPRTNLVQAATLFSIPGMVGEVPVLLAFDRVITSMSSSQSGLYAAFLFLGYAALLSTAIILQHDRTNDTSRANII